MRRLARAVVPTLMLLSSVSCATNTAQRMSRSPLTEDALTEGARAIHERVMALDTHVDIDPGNFRVDALNYSQRLSSQVDLTKMEVGGLDAVKTGWGRSRRRRLRTCPSRNQLDQQAREGKQERTRHPRLPRRRMHCLSQSAEPL